jgi:hypothetical protein
MSSAFVVAPQQALASATGLGPTVRRGNIGEIHAPRPAFDPLRAAMHLLSK